MTTSSLPAGALRQGINTVSLHLARDRRLTLFALACLVYFTTCGGAFGLEPLVSAVGPGWAVLLILVTPLVWSLPISLMVAELGTLMPEEGGYYVWVRESLGPFWAVQEAWWTMAYSVVLLAIFPVLFVSYLAYFFPSLAPTADAAHPAMGALIRWLLAVLVIVTAAFVNLRGAREVGRSAKVGAAVVLGAFALMWLVWLKQGPPSGAVFGLVSRGLSSNGENALLLGLSIIVYNYSGWDNVSTYAAEVDEPQRNYPSAIAIALLVVVLSYLLPVIVGLSLTTDPAIWNTHAGWPVIAQLIGGRWMGAVIAAAGLVSMWALFNAQLLYVSRLPFVMACDRWLPQAFAKVSPETAVPKTAIVGFCAITAVFAALSYGGLAVIQCLLYAAALTLEFLALIVLRLRRPHSLRPFRIPGGWFGMGYVCLAPFAFSVLVLIATLRDWRSFTGLLLVVGLVVLSGIFLYFVRRTAVLSSIRTIPEGEPRIESASEFPSVES